MANTGITYDDVRSREDTKDYIFSAQMIERTRELYLKRNLSVRQTIEEMGLSQYYEGNIGYFARAFSYYLPKGGKNRGGVRDGAGRPSGSLVCPGCGQLRTNCTCEEAAGEPGAPQILGVISRPSGKNDGHYTAAVAVEHRPGRYRAYLGKTKRYPTHADVQRTVQAGEEIPPAEARKIFAELLDYELSE